MGAESSRDADEPATNAATDGVVGVIRTAPQAVFVKFDTDHDGCLDEDEISRALDVLVNVRPSASLVRQLLIQVLSSSSPRATARAPFGAKRNGRATMQRLTHAVVVCRARPPASLPILNPPHYPRALRRSIRGRAKRV